MAFDPTQNLIPNEPDLGDLLEMWKKQIKLETCVHHLGTIQSFDPLTQTAKASINYKKTFLEVTVTGNTSTISKDYPLITDAPVLFLGGGGAAGGFLTFPVAAGDECLILFNDRDMDNWFAGSSSSNPSSNRLHSFSDALIVVGIRSLPNIIPSFDTNAVAFRYGLNSIKIYSDKIELTQGTNTITLNTTGVSIDLGPGMVNNINAAGTFSFTNTTGEFVAALIQALSTATAGGFPLLADLTVLQTFQE